MELIHSFHKVRGLGKMLLAAIAACLVVVPVVGQQHYNAWFRTTLSIPLSQKVKWDHEFQHRRQNGFDNENLLDRNLMFTYRSWFLYQRNDSWKFSFSPCGYFYHYKIIPSIEDKEDHPKEEFRVSMAAEWQKNVIKKLHLVGREGMEYRIFHDQLADQWRLRSKWGLKWVWNSKMHVFLFDELFLKMSKGSNDTSFDHNRVGVQFEFPIGRHLTIDTGCMHIVRRVNSIVPTLNESNVFLHLVYTLSPP
jgi:hypothetical protein